MEKYGMEKKEDCPRLMYEKLCTVQYFDPG